MGDDFIRVLKEWYVVMKMLFNCYNCYSNLIVL